MTIQNDARLKKIRFRAWHRGFQEADLLLGRFAESRLASMTPAELDEFEALLAEQDADLYAWAMKKTEVPAQFDGPLMAELQAFDVAAHARYDGSEPA